MYLSDLDYYYYEKLLENYSSKDKLYIKYQKAYYSAMFMLQVEFDATFYRNNLDDLSQLLLSQDYDIIKAPFGDGFHWNLGGETYYIYSSGKSVYIVQARSNYIVDITHCNVTSLIDYLNDVCVKADRSFERIISFVDLRLSYADEEERLDEQIGKVLTKCRKRIQQEKACEDLKGEFIALNRNKLETLHIPISMSMAEKQWLEIWDSMVDEFNRYWKEYRLKQVERNEIKKQEQEDALYREKVKEIFPFHKIKPLYTSHYWVYYRILNNGQAVAFIDIPGNPKKIFKYGEKFAELLDGVVSILKKKISGSSKVEKVVKKNRKFEKGNDLFLDTICELLKESKIKHSVECLPRSYAFDVFNKQCGISFTVSPKEFPNGTEELVKAISDFMNFASKAKLYFDIRIIK